MTRRTRSPRSEILAAMKRHGLTRQDVAAMAEVSLKTVHSWLSDKGAAHHRSPSRSALALLRMRLAERV